jgi:hypothetical protein
MLNNLLLFNHKPTCMLNNLLPTLMRNPMMHTKNLFKHSQLLMPLLLWVLSQNLRLNNRPSQ